MMAELELYFCTVIHCILQYFLIIAGSCLERETDSPHLREQDHKMNVNE